MEINIAKMIEISLPVLEGFKRIEPRHWGLDGTFLELNTEIGALGRVLTIWENYRHGQKSRHNLADELSDIFFVLVKVIQETSISVSDNLPAKKIQKPKQEFFRLIELVAELRYRTTNKKIPDTESFRKEIEEMFSIIGGFAVYYCIPLEKAHEEEMIFASLWQKLFFTSAGRKKSFSFLRKIIWKVATWQHQRKLEHKVP